MTLRNLCLSDGEGHCTSWVQTVLPALDFATPDFEEGAKAFTLPMLGWTTE
jgi:hypothetical protein